MGGRIQRHSEGKLCHFKLFLLNLCSKPCSQDVASPLLPHEPLFTRIITTFEKLQTCLLEELTGQSRVQRKATKMSLAT